MHALLSLLWVTVFHYFYVIRILMESFFSPSALFSYTPTNTISQDSQSQQTRKDNNNLNSSYELNTFFKDFIYLFLGRGDGREKERERNINVWLPLLCPLLGTWPETQGSALTWNQTGDPLVHRPVLNPLSHTSQSYELNTWWTPFISTQPYKKKLQLRIRGCLG